VGLFPFLHLSFSNHFYTKFFLLSFWSFLPHGSSVPLSVRTIKLTIIISRRSREIESTSNTEAKFTVRAARFTDVICLSGYSLHTVCLESMSNLVRDISNFLIRWYCGGGKIWLFGQDEDEICFLRYRWDRKIGLQPKSFSLLCLNS
jgi:hypothetical protein